MSLDVTLTCRCCESVVFERNITHNLTDMAFECGQGFYHAIWRPDELGFTQAVQLQTPIYHGLLILKQDRERLEKFNPDNGWGSYDGLVGFAELYLEACRKWPNATVKVCR